MGRNITPVPVFVRAAWHTLLRQPLSPRHLGDPLHLPRRLNDFLEVGEVLDLDEHRAVGPAVSAPEVHALDVGAGRAHGGGDVGVETATVVALEREADDESFALR